MREVMMRERFNTVAVGLPAQQFHIRCHVTLERQVPVMTEFAVRLLHVAGRVEVDAFRAYFGLSGHEFNEFLKILRAEDLVDETEGALTLTQYAMKRFVSMEDGLPRFTRIAERQSNPVFELVTFSPLPRALSGAYWDNTLDIDVGAAVAVSGRTIEKAQEAFQNHFHDIERFEQSDEEKRAYDVYKVDSIAAAKRFNVPLPIHFDVDLDGNVEYTVEGLEYLDEHISSSITQLTANRIGKLTSHADHFADFVKVFDDNVLARYMEPSRDREGASSGELKGTLRLKKTNAFRFADYVKEVHGIGDGLRYDDGSSRAVLGALYLSKNQNRLVEAFARSLREFKLKGDSSTLYPTQIYWVLPDSELWGRTDLVRKTIELLNQTVAKEWGEPLDVIAIAAASQNEAADKIKRKAHLLIDAGFSEVILGPGLPFSERFEVLILPSVHAAAMYQWRVPTQDVLSVPIGFLTFSPPRLNKLLVYLQNACDATIHRARRGKDEERGRWVLQVHDVSLGEFQHLESFKVGSV
ncbi:hypothetical protein PQR29_06265 [Paraburkholderia strydomiana]|jgi:hypothetical protein|uniref:hypothetical protein n=1 Tax=Paraburkholderia strydomiana TaxID=1245417 RepID=UPI0038BC7E9A